MTRAKNLFFILAAPFFYPSHYAFAEASFEGTQNGILRNSFELFGASIEDVAVDASGRVYAAANAPNGIFCLENGSSVWSDPPAGTDLGTTHAIALGGTPGTAFVIAGIRLFKTTDGCQNWARAVGTGGPNGFDDYGFRLAYGSDTLLVQNRDGTIDRSTDDGATFTRVTIVSGAQEVRDVAASPTNGEFYALVKKDNVTTLYRSTNSGADWSPTGKSGEYERVAVDPENAMRVAIGSPQGDVELSINGASSFDNTNAPPTSKTKLVFVHSRLYKGNAYTDDGMNWTLLQKTSSEAAIYGPVAGHPSDTSLLYAGTALGIGKSADTAATFSEVINGMYAVSVQEIAQATDKNIVFLGTGQGLAKTSNFLSEAGPTWTLPVTINPADRYSPVFSIHFDRSNQARMYAGTIAGKIFFSSDSGATWTEATVESVLDSDITDIQQTTDGTLFAAYGARGPVSRGGVLRSTDQGVNWNIISTGEFDLNTNTLLAVDNTILAGTGNDQDQSNPAAGIYRFDGSSWSKVSGVTDRQLVTSIVATGNILLASSAADSDQNGGVFRSKDKGATWSEVTSKGLRTSAGWYVTMAVDFQNPDIIYVAHGRPAGTAEMYYSQDRGETWSLLFTGLVDEVPQAMLVDGLTVGSGVGFSGVEPRKSVSLKLSISKRNALTTLTDAGQSLKQQKISIEVKKGKTFTRFQTKTTNDKGKVSFNLKKVKPGAKLRARFLTALSKTKKN